MMTNVRKPSDMRVTCSQASSAYSENLEITDSKHVAVSGLLMEVVMGHDRYPMVPSIYACVRGKLGERVRISRMFLFPNFYRLSMPGYF